MPRPLKARRRQAAGHVDRHAEFHSQSERRHVEDDYVRRVGGPSESLRHGQDFEEPDVGREHGIEAARRGRRSHRLPMGRRRLAADGSDGLYIVWNRTHHPGRCPQTIVTPLPDELRPS